MKYATFDVAGLPLAFYADDVHGAPIRAVYGEPPEVVAGEQPLPRPIIGQEPNPDCLIPPGALEITEEQWREFIENPGSRRFVDGQVVEYEPPAPVPTIDDYRRAIQAHLDATAGERGYDSIHTAVGYRDDPNPIYAAEAQALFVWRSAVWTFTFAEMAKVQLGQRSQPTVSDFVTELPAMVWPA